MTQTPDFVYVPDPETWPPPAGRVVRISRQLRTKRAVLGVFRKEFQLPEYFGWNWDALLDGLRDLPDQGPYGSITLIHDGLPFGPDSTRSRRTYLELLHALVAESEVGGLRWTIVFPNRVRAEVERATADEAGG